MGSVISILYSCFPFFMCSPFGSFIIKYIIHHFNCKINMNILFFAFNDNLRVMLSRRTLSDISFDAQNIRPAISRTERPSKKSRWDFSAETSALPALVGGDSANSHSCADRSYFSDAHVVGKIDLKCPLCGQKRCFSTDCPPCHKQDGYDIFSGGKLSETAHVCN